MNNPQGMKRGRAAGGRNRVHAPRRRRALISIIVAVLFCGLVGTTAMAVLHLQRNITTAPLGSRFPAEDPVPDGERNILLLGSDARDESSTAYGSDHGSRRSDAMVLVHFAAENERIDAVQLPRDTLMQLPACEDHGHGAYPGGYGMINSALNYGPACSVAAVEELSGVRIDNFIELDFEGFITVVDALDGLPVCLPEALKDPKAKLDLPADQQTVNGKDALALARTRHAVGDGSDIARMAHQQMVMSAIVQHVTSREVLTRPDRLYSFLDAATSAMTVNPGLESLSSLVSLARQLADVPTSQISFLTMPWSPAPQNPNRVVPSAEAQTVFASLRADRPLSGEEKKAKKKQKSKPVRSAPVRITNGAGLSGLAAEYSAEVSALGHTVSGTDTARQLQASTVLLVDGSDAALVTAKTLASDLHLDLTPQVGAASGVQLVLCQDIDQLDQETAAPQRTPEAKEGPTPRSADAGLCSG